MTAADAMRVAFVSGDALGVSAEALLGEEEPPALDQRPDPDEVRLPPTARCVLLRGDAARALMPDLRLEMYAAGCAPCVFGTFTESNAGQPLGKIAAGLVRAFETYWDLPGDPAERRAGGSLRIDGDEVAVAETSGPLEWATSTSWPGEEEWTPANATVALAVTMDRATVFDPPASWEAHVDENGDGDGWGRGRGRRAAGSLGRSAVVSLDGIVGDDLRAALLDAATEPGGPTPPPSPPPRLNGRARPRRDRRGGVPGPGRSATPRAPHAGGIDRDGAGGDRGVRPGARSSARGRALPRVSRPHDARGRAGT